MPGPRTLFAPGVNWGAPDTFAMHEWYTLSFHVSWEPRHFAPHNHTPAHRTRQTASLQPRSLNWHPIICWAQPAVLGPASTRTTTPEHTHPSPHTQHLELGGSAGCREWSGRGHCGRSGRGGGASSMAAGAAGTEVRGAGWFRMWLSMRAAGALQRLALLSGQLHTCHMLPLASLCTACPTKLPPLKPCSGVHSAAPHGPVCRCWWCCMRWSSSNLCLPTRVAPQALPCKGGGGTGPKSKPARRQDTTAQPLLLRTWWQAWATLHPRASQRQLPSTPMDCGSTPAPTPCLPAGPCACSAWPCNFQGAGL